MNLPNQLTLLRMGLAFAMPVFLLTDFPFSKTLALLVFVIASITDYWDGRLARTRCGISTFGQLMDPLADKILVCSVFICFVAQDQIVPAWIVIVIISREFMVTGLRLLAANQGRIIPAGRWGKHKTVWQIVAIIAILVGELVRNDLLPLLVSPKTLAPFLVLYYDPFFAYVTFAVTFWVAALTVISGWVYFRECKDMVMKDA